MLLSSQLYSLNLHLQFSAQIAASVSICRSDPLPSTARPPKFLAEARPTATCPKRRLRAVAVSLFLSGGINSQGWDQRGMALSGETGPQPLSVPWWNRLFGTRSFLALPPQDLSSPISPENVPNQHLMVHSLPPAFC